jgi:hypothetical protein
MASKKGACGLSLGSGEQFASLTVNEYETLLMRYDLAEVLKNPLRFAAQKAKHAWNDPRAVPSKAIDYAKYDLVRAVNRLVDALGLAESTFERVFSQALAVPASRFLRMKRSGRSAGLRYKNLRTRRRRRRHLPGAHHGAVAQGRPRRAAGCRDADAVRLTYPPFTTNHQPPTSKRSSDCLSLATSPGFFSNTPADRVIVRANSYCF